MFYFSYLNKRKSFPSIIICTLCFPEIFKTPTYCVIVNLQILAQLLDESDLIIHHENRQHLPVVYHQPPHAAQIKPYTFTHIFNL